MTHTGKQELAAASNRLPAELASATTATVSAIEAKQAADTRRAYASALANYDA